MRNHVEGEDEDDVDCGNIRRRHPPRRPVAYDEDEDDYEIQPFPHDALVELLEDIEQRRQRLHLDLKYLQALLAREPELAEKYREFQRRGGVSAFEFERFLHNRLQLRPRISHSRRHLRLIATSDPVKRSRPRIRRGGNDDDDAA
jgi:hypothetical protein